MYACAYRSLPVVCEIRILRSPVFGSRLSIASTVWPPAFQLTGKLVAPVNGYLNEASPWSGGGGSDGAGSFPSGPLLPPLPPGLGFLGTPGFVPALKQCLIWNLHQEIPPSESLTCGSPLYEYILAVEKHSTGKGKLYFR